MPHIAVKTLITRGLGVLLTVGLFSCGPKNSVASETAQSPLAVAFQFDSTSFHVGTQRVTVTVHDSTGAAVTGASVRISPSFATVPGGHSMAMRDMGRTLKAISAVDAGDGAYHANIDLTKATHWTLVADVSTVQSHAIATGGIEVQ